MSRFTASASRRLVGATALLLLGAPFASAQATSSGDSAPAGNDQPIQLDAFSVQDRQDFGYRKTGSVTASRIGVPLSETPQAVEVISSELLSDFGLSQANDVFQFSSSVTYNKNEVAQTGSFTLRGFELPRYIDGVYTTAFPGSTPEFTADNIDRVEVVKGPVGLFYGNSTPNGVANYVTKKPEFTHRSTLEAIVGNEDYFKTILDIQDTIDKGNKFAYRVIGSFYNTKTRADGQHYSYAFVAPSLTFRPSSRFEIDANLSYSKFQEAYPRANQWNWTINPLYYQDLQNPGAQLLSYIKTKYGAADDTAAKAVMAQRWGKGVAWATWLTNWAADRFAAYGTQPFWFSGTSVDWSRYSPQGSSSLAASPDSNLDGDSMFVDIGATLNPWQGAALRYRQIEINGNNNFDRFLQLPNGGLRPNGEVDTMTASFLLQKRHSVTDTQQLDFDQQYDIPNILKNTFTAGMEWRRTFNDQGAAATDFSRYTTTVTNYDGSTYTGAAAYSHWDPFTNPYPTTFGVVSSQAILARTPVFQYRDMYASYRGSALNDRLHLLLGWRNVKRTSINGVAGTPNDNTFTYGAIYEFAPGFHVFASHSNTFQFSDAYSEVNVSGQPVAGAKLLDPETGRGYEIGLKSSWRDDTLSGTVSYYDEKRSGVTKSDVAANLADPLNNDSDSTNDVRHSVNGGLLEVAGVDADLIWTPNRQLQILLNYEFEPKAGTLADPSVDKTTLNQAYIKEFQRRLQKSPENKANLVGKYNFNGGFFDNCSVGGAIRYSGRYNLSDSAVTDIVILPTTQFDAFAEYRTKIVGIPTAFHLSVDNITNVRDDYVNMDGIQVKLSTKLTF